MKLSSLVLLFSLTLIAGCVSPMRQQAAEIATTFNLCKENAKLGPQRAAIAAKLYPEFKNIDVVMMSDQRYPSQAELEAAKPYFRDRLACNRDLVAGVERISRGSGGPKLASRKRANRTIESAVAEFLSGGVTYGSYFTKLKSVLHDYEERNAALDAQAKQQQTQTRSAPAPIFKPYCPPSKYPIYGCPPSTSSAGSSSYSKPPPGNKTCTYRSGPYQWTKTVNGYTCPATDSSNGYFGTLVR